MQKMESKVLNSHSFSDQTSEIVTLQFTSDSDKWIHNNAKLGLQNKNKWMQISKKVILN